MIQCHHCDDPWRSRLMHGNDSHATDGRRSRSSTHIVKHSPDVYTNISQSSTTRANSNDVTRGSCLFTYNTTRRRANHQHTTPTTTMRIYRVYHEVYSQIFFFRLSTSQLPKLWPCSSCPPNTMILPRITTALAARRASFRFGSDDSNGNHLRVTVL